ncbi:MAG: hypothetical protein INQ03_01850 [Candidatus Heimdallarchaeota archaeon]|nr:hypothetical protein [Candidatus Heimdallarchaeota archaeon]
MTIDPIEYCGVVILHANKNWEIEVLSLQLDGKHEFLYQWFDLSMDPIYAILNKIKRTIGIEPDILSLYPVYHQESPRHIRYYTCLLNPTKTILSLVNYEHFEWYDPRALYLKIQSQELRNALMAAIEWIDENRNSALVLLRNQMALDF